jgi:hypothetical protein
VSEHWASSAFSIQATRSFDSVKIILPGVFAAIADAVLRKKATDIPSEVQRPDLFAARVGMRSDFLFALRRCLCI